MKNETWEPDLGHEDVAMFEVRDYEKLLYCMELTEDGWVALDRHYRRMVGGGYLGDPGEEVAVHYTVDPRGVDGCFALVVGNRGYLYKSQLDSAPEYVRRLDRLLALRSD